jgi:deoxyribodipyrimidine photolyase-related protein
LSPQQIVEAALKRHAEKPVALGSLEGFIRQVLGWREYMRGQYLTHSSIMHGHNEFKNLRRMTPAWSEGALGLPPFDDLVQKLQTHGYAHNAERLFIAGGLMVMAEIHPEDIERWFFEVGIDSFDWILTPNLYGLTQFGDPDNKISIAPSTVILQLSNYERGEWADIWDGLYWRFIEKHRETFRHNARMRTVVQRLDRLDPDRKRIIGYRADDFLANFTR